MKILENGILRDATPEEIVQRDLDIADALARRAQVVEPTKEELLAQINALAAQVQALGQT